MTMCSIIRGHAVEQFVEDCATSHKVVGSMMSLKFSTDIIFLAALWPWGGVTQPLTEMSTRNISWGGGKGGRCVVLTTLPPS